MTHLDSKLRICAWIIVGVDIAKTVLSFLMLDTYEFNYLTLIWEFIVLLAFALALYTIAEMYERLEEISKVTGKYNDIARDNFHYKEKVKSWRCSECCADNGENDEKCRVCGAARKATTK